MILLKTSTVAAATTARACLYWHDSRRRYLWLYTTHTHLPKQYWEWSEEDGVLLGALSGMVMGGHGVRQRMS